MRSLLVIVSTPSLAFSLRVVEAHEPAGVQTFFAQASVKALDVSVLDRLSRPDVDQLDALIKTPGQIGPTGELRTVVAANALRRSALGDDAIQHANYT